MEDVLKSFGIIIVVCIGLFSFATGADTIGILCIVSIVCAFLAGIVGEGRKIDKGTAFALGMFLGIIGVIIVATFERESDGIYKEKMLENLSGNKVDRLIKLGEMREKGLISNEEFEEYKSNI